MFLGHFAVGLAAKRVAPAVSLGTLFLAAQFADLLWPNLLLFGVERVVIRPGITVLLTIQLGAVFGPPPPSVAAVAWSAQAVWLLVALGYWVDRHRYATIPLPRANA